MANLVDIDLEYEEVALPNGKSFSVRGLSLADVTEIIKAHSAEVQGFFLKYAGNPERLKQTGVADAGLVLLEGAPALAAEIIALAADAPDQAPKVTKFTMGVQLDALDKIAKLTFDAAGGPKKFMEAVIRLVQGTTNVLTDLNRSKIGSLVSDAT